MLDEIGEMTPHAQAKLLRAIESNEFERLPGGLGLHLIPRLVDSVQYGYSEGERCSRIVFRKTSAAPSPGSAERDGEERC